MTAVETRNKILWNSLPHIIKNRIEEEANSNNMPYHKVYKIVFYKTIYPDIFYGIEDTMDKLKDLGYGVRVTKVNIDENEIDEKLIIEF